MVLACAEIKNHFAKVKGTGKINLMTITEQEDFNIGKYGYRDTLKALRSNKDTIFFAGPCAGVLAWNRLNESKKTLRKIEQKKDHFLETVRRFC